MRSLTTVFGIFIILAIESTITKFFSINAYDTGAGWAGTFALIRQTFFFKLTKCFILIGIVTAIEVLIAYPFVWYATTSVIMQKFVRAWNYSQWLLTFLNGPKTMNQMFKSPDCFRPASKAQNTNCYLIRNTNECMIKCVLTFSSIQIADYCTVAVLCNFPRQSHRHNQLCYHSARPMVGMYRLYIGRLLIHTCLSIHSNKTKSNKNSH